MYVPGVQTAYKVSDCVGVYEVPTLVPLLVVDHPAKSKPSLVCPVTSGSVTAELPTVYEEEAVSLPLPPFQSYEIV